ncbi:MAG: ABC transporter substrate-binding protein [Hyphomicrobiaceae bacterium]|nr:MAG: ABC transporter substrate-binding protein [Hyphomicrobiaceae bacterium]
MRRLRIVTHSAAAFATVVLLLSAGTRAQGPPRRIVSVNLCTDQLLMLLVEPSRIAAVSHLARDPSLSALAEEARKIAIVHANAEEVLRADPDLVLAGPWTTRATGDLLRRLGRRVAIVPLAQDLDGVRAAVREVARLTGAEARGEEIVAAFDRRRAEIEKKRPSSPRTAVVYHVAGLASGTGTLADAVLRAAGLRNAAEAERLDAKGALALERLLADPPDLVVLGHAEDEYRTVQADNLRHPALRRLLERVESVHIPQRLMICASPKVLDAVELLVDKRRALP